LDIVFQLNLRHKAISHVYNSKTQIKIAILLKKILSMSFYIILSCLLRVYLNSIFLNHKRYIINFASYFRWEYKYNYSINIMEYSLILQILLPPKRVLSEFCMSTMIILFWRFQSRF